MFECHLIPTVDYDFMIGQKLTPTLLELYNLVNDDFKWKTLSYNVIT